MEETHDQINVEVVVDTALEDQTVMTASKSEMSSNNQVVSMEVLGTNSAVTQFVGDYIGLIIVSIDRNNPFHSMGHLSGTTFV